MKNKQTVWLVLWIMCCGIFSGCSRKEQAWIPISAENTITLAVAGDDDFYLENGVPQAMELAAEDFCKKTGITLEIQYYNDDADYQQAISLAQEIAADNSVAAVLGKPEIDFVDTIADIYEKAEKPYFVMSGCYDHTLHKGYQYLINDSICASAAGCMMGRYVKKQGYQRTVFCHSDTEYEEDELKGFQAELAESDALLAGTLLGPFTQEDFELAYEEWEMLDVDVICISNAYILNGNLARMLRKKGSDIAVISDYIMDDEEDISRNGDYLNGTVIVPLYMMSESGSETNGTAVRFLETYGFEMSELAVQAYDLVMMISEKLLTDCSSPKAFMNAVRHPDGYEGLCGTVRYDENGSLIPENAALLVFKDGMFRPITEDQ